MSFKTQKYLPFDILYSPEVIGSSALTFDIKRELRELGLHLTKKQAFILAVYVYYI